MNSLATTSDSNISFARRSETMLAALLLMVIITLLVPMPTMLLDMLLAMDIAATILLLLIALSAMQPLDLSVFPSLLLLLTLYRLSLNVATTRLILLDGDAGRLVTAFGGMVVGGNLVVGLVVFLILVIIQFVVITKGAGRISEVAARFTLDAMPGKQMAIDAELNSGAIDDIEARTRRAQLTREAEFHGAMDGASKFVRGDAIAGLIITAVNLLGGVVLGLANGLSFAEAARRYSILTIGDGLISQIPALIVATTSGMIVTKAASNSTLGTEIGMQLLKNRRPLWIGAGILAVLGLAPGMPKVPFLVLSGMMVLFLRKFQERESSLPSTGPPPQKAVKEDREKQQLNSFLQTDRVSLEIGRSLIPLVDTNQSKGLADRISSLRTDLTRKHHLWVPSIRIRDSLELRANEYRILISGREVARSDLQPDRMLAIDPGGVRFQVDGDETHEPSFGLPARWIQRNDRQRAELAGYTVVDPPTIVVTHLGEVLQRHAAELLSREDLNGMLEHLKNVSPTIVDELKPEVLRVSTVHSVLVQLLQERVPITNLVGIIESLLNHAGRTKDPGELVELVRGDLSREICERFRDEEGRVRVIVLEPHLENRVREALQENGTLALPPAHYQKFVTRLDEEVQKLILLEQEAALLLDSSLRRPVRRAVERAVRDLGVISYTEVSSDLIIEPVAMIRLIEVFGEPAASGSTSVDELSAA